jgi:hypothetical protein
MERVAGDIIQAMLDPGAYSRREVDLWTTDLDPG